MAKKSGEIRIGCSGWNYKHWRGRFYPEKQSQKQWFSFYARSFDTVEINNTFYRLPAPETFKAWKKQAPSNFIYAVKASRFLTHIKRLKDPKEPLKRFFDGARLLGDHLGPILYQLPPRWHADLGRLDSFLQALPEKLLHVFEFRDQSWLVDEVFKLLDETGASLCVHDMPGMEVPRMAIGAAVYVRFHGAHEKYRGGYMDSALEEWWRWMEKEVKKGKNLYVYFNNDVEAHAVYDAMKLKRMVGVNDR